MYRGFGLFSLLEFILGALGPDSIVVIWLKQVYIFLLGQPRPVLYTFFSAWRPPKALREASQGVPGRLPASKRLQKAPQKPPGPILQPRGGVGAQKSSFLEPSKSIYLDFLLLVFSCFSFVFNVFILMLCCFSLSVRSSFAYSLAFLLFSSCFYLAVPLFFSWYNYC